MTNEGKKERYSVSLSQDVAGRLKEQAAGEGTPRAVVLARIIDEYYNSTPTADYKAQLQKCKEESVILWHKIDQFKEDTAENAAAHEETVKSLQNELESSKTRTESLEQEAADKDTKIELLEQDLTAALGTVEALDHSSHDLIGKLKAEGENYQRSLAEQERRHKDVITEEEHRQRNIANALRHEQELTAAKLESVQLQLQQERDHNLELRTDKEQLQKQLELVTLRLPAPKEGFWARVFGRRKKEEERAA